MAKAKIFYLVLTVVVTILLVVTWAAGLTEGYNVSDHFISLVVLLGGSSAVFYLSPGNAQKRAAIALGAFLALDVVLTYVVAVQNPMVVVQIGPYIAFILAGTTAVYMWNRFHNKTKA